MVKPKSTMGGNRNYRKKGNIIDRQDILQTIERKMTEYGSYIHVPSTSQEDNQELKILKHYFYLNEMLSLLIAEMGGVGKALQGEDDLAEGLLNIASLCANWLENIEKPLS